MPCPNCGQGPPHKFHCAVTQVENGYILYLINEDNPQGINMVATDFQELVGLMRKHAPGILQAVN